MKEISNIKFYQVNATVFFTDGTSKEVSWDGYDCNDDVMELWDFFLEEECVSPASRDKWMPKCNRLYFNK